MKTDRELRPGEAFFSVLLPEASGVVRHDYAADQWDGPPENALGWWKSEVPDPKSKKVHWAPNDVMLHYFQQLENEPDKHDIRYVLTLLMIRRRILRLDENKQDDNDVEKLVVFCHRNETEYEVAVFEPDAKRIQEIQAELSELLFAKAT